MLRNLRTGAIKRLTTISTTHLIANVLLSIAVLATIYIFLVVPHPVDGPSMLPGLQNEDYLLTEKLSLQFKWLHKGNIVVFTHPTDDGLILVKRVIGLPGDSVRISEGKVFVNNQLVSEPYLYPNATTKEGFAIAENSDLLLSADEYFLMGDNRENSVDSRSFGPVQKTSLKGKVFLLYLPLSRFRFIR